METFLLIKFKMAVNAYQKNTFSLISTLLAEIDT